MLQAPVQFGGLTVRPGDLVFGNSDGIVIIEEDRIDDVYAAAITRQKKESEIIGKLREGRTTIELLGPSDPASQHPVFGLLVPRYARTALPPR